MTRKLTLQRWASGLGAELPESATVQDLEQAIESAKNKPQPAIPTLGESVAIHWNITRTQVPATVKAIASNLLN